MSDPLVNSHASLESVTTIAFSHDKSFIASRYDDGSIKIWDITQHHLVSKGANPSQVRFTKDGRIVSCWENGAIRSWDENYEPYLDFVST